MCPKYNVKKLFHTAHNSYGLERIVSLCRYIFGGNDNLNAPRPLADDHRSINWDADAVPFNLPFDFFDKTVTKMIGYPLSFRAKLPNSSVDSSYSAYSLRFSRTTSQFTSGSLLRTSAPLLLARARC